MMLACFAFPAQFSAAGEPLAQIGSALLSRVEGWLDHLTLDARSQRLCQSLRKEWQLQANA